MKYSEIEDQEIKQKAFQENYARQLEYFRLEESG